MDRRPPGARRAAASGRCGRLRGMTDASPPLRMVAVSLDCADPGELARFYLALLGGETLWSSPRSTGIRVPGGGVLVPQRVEGYQPPEWPGSPLVHLDLTGGPGMDGTGLGGAVARAVAAGAKESAFQPDPRFRVLLDPAGHPFCITTVVPAGVTLDEPEAAGS
jgi:Glyoxalase-like domain